jgi:hypothetical protein
MQRKNVGTYIHALFLVLQIMIITSVGIEKYQNLTYRYNVVG